MKKSYSALSTVSKIFNVFGYLTLVTEFIFILGVSNTSKQNELIYSIMILIGSLFVTVIISLGFWAISQFIKLCINVAEDINTMNENTFFIADLFAKTVKDNTQRPIEVTERV